MVQRSKGWGAPRVAASSVAAVAVLGECGRAVPLLDAINTLAPATAAAGLALAIAAIARRRWRMALGMVMIATLPGARLAREWLRPIPTADAGAPATMTIVTHNLRMDNRTPGETLAALAASGADVLLLQEADGTAAPFLSALARRYPYGSRCSADGCALLIRSRWPIVETRYRIRDAKGRQIGMPLVWATVAPPGQPPFDIATLHLTWPLPPRAQARQRRELVTTIGHLALDRLVLAGDFNLTPWSAAMARLDRDLTPLTRATRARWSYPARVGAGMALPLPLLPIDQLYAGPGWAVQQLERLPRTGSDHYPIRIRLTARDG